MHCCSIQQKLRKLYSACTYFKNTFLHISSHFLALYTKVCNSDFKLIRVKFASSIRRPLEHKRLEFIFIHHFFFEFSRF